MPRAAALPVHRALLGLALSSLTAVAHAQEDSPPAAAAAPDPAPSAAAPPASPNVPPPAPLAPSVPPPAAAPVAVPAPVAVVPAAARVVLSPGDAVVHVAVTHRDAWLETRSAIDGGDFQRTCQAPCDIKLPVDGREARVVAPGMTTSNVFRFDAGVGVAAVRVDGGSARARHAGIITLAAGIPVALAGMAMFALGRVKDNSGIEAAGIAGLAVGGVSVGVSLPLLLMGTTHVKNSKGSLIALSASTSSL